MKNFSVLLLFIFFIPAVNLFAQEEPDSIEVYLIDDFVPPENPNLLKLSFYTSDIATSKVIINDENEVDVSKELTDNHKADIDISSFNFNKKTVPFIIIVTDSAGNTYTSEKYEFELPYDVKVKEESNFLLFCLFGGAVFGLPAPTYVKWGNNNYFELTKEIPILSFRSSGIGYPIGYFSIEYSYMINAPVNSYFRIGYKHLIDVPGIEFVSPGVNGFTNFKGFNGISPELTIGWIKVFNTFTIYTRYRFNVKPGANNSEFHEFSLGFYSGFFSIYL